MAEPAESALLHHSAASSVRPYWSITASCQTSTSGDRHGRPGRIRRRIDAGRAWLRIDRIDVVPARYLSSPAQAPAHVAGYTISNDVSERAFQTERGGQWSEGENGAVPGGRDQYGHAGGVATGRADIANLKKGDVVELDMDRLGRQRQQFDQA